FSYSLCYSSPLHLDLHRFPTRRSSDLGSFTLQSVVMEYVTTRLIAEVTSEIKQGRFSRLVEHSLELAPSQEYVRQTQQRLLVARSEEHTSELQSPDHLVCRLLLENKKQ